jgi:hypothetical protein
MSILSYVVVLEFRIQNNNECNVNVCKQVGLW